MAVRTPRPAGRARSPRPRGAGRTCRPRAESRAPVTRGQSRPSPQSEGDGRFEVQPRTNRCTMEDRYPQSPAYRGAVTTESRMDKGLDNRSRDENGEIRAKRNDTTVRSLRQTYGDGFAPGTRSDAQLRTVLK